MVICPEHDNDKVFLSKRFFGIAGEDRCKFKENGMSAMNLSLYAVHIKFCGCSEEKNLLSFQFISSMSQTGLVSRPDWNS